MEDPQFGQGTYVAEYAKSIESARHALDLYRATDDTYWQGTSSATWRNVSRKVGESGDALGAARDALALARARRLAGRGFNLEALGTIHLARGELEQAFQHYHEALAVMHDHPYPAEEAATWNGLGELSIARRSWRRGSAFGNALALARKASDTAGALKVLSNLGASRWCAAGLRSRAPSARGARRGALAPASARGVVFAHRAWRLVPRARGAGPRRADLSAAAVRAAEISQRDSEASAWQGLGDAFARLARPEDAADAYRRAHEVSSRISDRAAAATALASLARLDAASNRSDTASTHMDEALGLIEASRPSLSSPTLPDVIFCVEARLLRSRGVDSDAPRAAQPRQRIRGARAGAGRTRTGADAP